MRTLSLLLILANVLYFVWSQLIDVNVGVLDRAPVNVGRPVPAITLAHEQKPAEQPAGESAQERAEELEPQIQAVQPPAVEPLNPAQQEVATAEVADAEPLSCTSVGPFAELPMAEQAQAALQSAGYQPRQREEQAEIWVGYWVSIQGLPSRKAADAAMKTLRANGITDVYLMPGTDHGNILSLGVFSDLQRAHRRSEDVRSLGLSPQIENRKRSGPVYWLDVELKQPGEPLDMTLFETDPGKITRLEMRPCPAPASG
jgi:hypothetical protein